ncbi:MAG: tetratricopeptide repeat protein, partial [Myxococcales bacterium]|nr:tetratricopeptide repeat protein [Myxococcales bacterium]
KNLILNNPFLTQSATLWRAFTHGFWELTNVPQPIPMYRPLVIVSYYLEHALWGGVPGGYHATNLCLHVVNAVLVGAVGRELLRSPWAGLVAALVFLVHPVQHEAIGNIASRTDLLATAFGLGATYLWFHPASDRTREVRNQWSALVLLSFALLSKESAIVWPALWLTFAWGTRRGVGLPSRELGPWILTAMYLALRSAVLGGGSFDAPDAGWQGGLRLTYYAIRFVAPASHGPTWEPAAGGIGWSIGLALGWFLLTGALLRRARTRTLGWCVLGALVALAPVAELLPIRVRFSDLLMYTSMVPAAFAVGWGATRFGGGPPLAILACLVVTPWTAAEVGHFQSDRALWGHALAHDAHDATAELNYANALRAAGDEREGCARLAVLRTRLEHADTNRIVDRVDYNLGNCALRRGEVAEAADHFEHAYAHSGGRLWQAGLNRALALLRIGRHEAALAAAVAVSREHPEIADVHEAVGVLHAQRGDWPSASESFRRALELDPNRPRTQAMFADVERRLRERTGAR